MASVQPSVEKPVRIAADGISLDGDLAIPAGARGLVVFAHGSGSSRHSQRNRAVAQSFRDAGLGTLLLDLLTREEDALDRRTAEFRFDIELLANRVASTLEWLARQKETAGLRIGLFGASTGAAAALIAASTGPQQVAAVVSRGGRPDLAGEALRHVTAPTLLIVGGRDHTVIELNRRALAELSCERHLQIVPGATHLFEEPGTLDEVARFAGAWFSTHLLGKPTTHGPEESRG
ncbi:MAG TPA: alpha/beta family hydrolase [Vicinamibacterales bacterium]|nr:alpha/beta family hydrolase [Vicinamibacterales bacterium]